MNRQIRRLWWMGFILLGAMVTLSACKPGTETPTPTPAPYASDFGVTWTPRPTLAPCPTLPPPPVSAPTAPAARSNFARQNMGGYNIV